MTSVPSRSSSPGPRNLFLAAPALLLSLLVLVPFLGKPFTIDDTVFMREAQQALRDPLHPTAFSMTWRVEPERVSQHVPTGPVMAWLLVPAALAGGAEWPAHVVQLILLWAAVIATVSLARRLELPARWAAAAGVLLGAMPAVLAMSGTAMPDVAGMALGAIGMERLAAWGSERRLAQGTLAALLLGLAALTRSHQLLLVGVGAILLLGAGSGIQGWKATVGVAWPLLVAPFVTAAGVLATRDPLHGSTAMLTAAAYYSFSESRRFASNLVAIPIHWVLSMAFSLPWLALRWRAILRDWPTLAAGAAGAAVSVAALYHARQLDAGLALAGAIGVATLWDVLSEGRRGRDRVTLALGAWLLLAACTMPYVHVPAKYLVASAPAAAILVAREMSRRSARHAWAVLVATTLAGAGLGAAILRADEAHGETGRRAVAEAIVPNVSSGRRVWFVGHWGFQWYAERAGARPVTVTPPYPQPGDIVVVGLGTAPDAEVLMMLRDQYRSKKLVGRIEDPRPGGRLMNRKLGAGFYSNIYGLWPWRWADFPTDVFSVFEIH
jgi:hypothetical protein